jgi:integrase
MAIRLPSHLHRARSGILHFRIAIPPDLRQYFNTVEIYRSLRTASVREAAPAAQALTQALKRAFHQLRSGTMSSNKKTPTDPFDGSEWGLKLEIDFDEFLKPKKLNIQSELGDAPDAVPNALAAIFGGGGAGHTGTAEGTLAPAESENVSAYIDPYFDSLPAEQRPKGKTLEQYRASIQTFIKIVGDKPLLELGRKDANRFEDVITKMPANSTKLANTRALSMDEVVALGLPPMSLTNAKNISRRTNKFLRWAFRRLDLDVPFQLLDEIKVAKRPKSDKARRQFTDDELRLIFNAETIANARQAKPYMFWLPLIAAHSGMRINEIAQLLLSDITVIDGVTCFNVTDELDPADDDDWPEDMPVAERKSLKSDAAKRQVPIHPELLDLGLLSYAQALREVGHKRLFPELSAEGRDGPGQAASKHFGRYLDQIKLKDKQLVFHSFRHGVISRLRRIDIPKELRKLVVGHSAVDDTHDGYGDVESDYSIQRRLDAIKELNFDGVIDYDRLRQRIPTLELLSKGMEIERKRSLNRARKNATSS